MRCLLLAVLCGETLELRLIFLDQPARFELEIFIFDLESCNNVFKFGVICLGALIFCRLELKWNRLLLQLNDLVAEVLYHQKVLTDHSILGLSR
jgi:hypothetical protein